MSQASRHARHTLTSRTSSPARPAIRVHPSTSAALYKYSTHVHSQCERHPDGRGATPGGGRDGPRNDRRGTVFSHGIT